MENIYIDLWSVWFEPVYSRLKVRRLMDLLLKSEVVAVTGIKLSTQFASQCWDSISFSFIAIHMRQFTIITVTLSLFQGILQLISPHSSLSLSTPYGWGATSDNRAKIDDFAPTRSLWSKISGTRGRPPPIIFARLVRPMNALQLCCWQFSHKETL